MNPNLREVLEALEDDAFVDNDLSDEFFQKLDEERLFDVQEFDVDDGEYDDDDYDDSDDGFGGKYQKEEWEEFKKLKKKSKKNIEDDDEEEYEEMKSRTTGGYSMTSSIMYRNDK